MDGCEALTVITGELSEIKVGTYMAVLKHNYADD